MQITKNYSLVRIALIVVELFQEKTNLGEFWSRDWSFTENMEAPENIWEYDFDE